MIEDYVGVMVDIICQYGVDGLVLLLNICCGKLLVVKLGYCFKVVVFNDVSIVSVQDGKVIVKYMVYGGLVIGEECIVMLYVVLIISSGMFDVVQLDVLCIGEMYIVEWQVLVVVIICMVIQVCQSNSVDFDKVCLVVSVGCGIGSKENIVLVEQFCKVIGVELVCFCLVVENEKWMEYECYVGIFNLMLKFELYLVVGIFGQIQYMVGVNVL